MRRLAALALLLMLPGLLLPAGLLLRVCRCAERVLASAPATTSCCAKARQAEPAAAPTCCGQHDQRQRFPAGEDTIDAVPCKCIWVKVTDREPDPVPLPLAVHFDCHAPPVAGFAVPPFDGRGQQSRWLAAANRAPPPDHERSLPLLL